MQKEKHNRGENKLNSDKTFSRFSIQNDTKSKKQEIKV